MEAIIVMPVFLCFFFLLLFLIKTACIYISLDHAVRESAKEIAASAYPLSFLNDFEEGVIEEDGIIEKAQQPTVYNGTDRIKYENSPERSIGLLDKLFSGKITAGDLNNLLKNTASEVFTNYSRFYYTLKDKGKYYVVMAVMDKYLAGSYIERENLYFSLVEFPQNTHEFENKKEIAAYREAGLVPDEDFGKDDVVIQVEYELKIPLPFFRDRKITLRHAAVERAWLLGGNGVYTNPEDRSIFDIDPVIVYITRTGEKYHLGDCRYLRKSKIPVTLDYAKKMGYQPCKVCKPPP